MRRRRLDVLRVIGAESVKETGKAHDMFGTAWVKDAAERAIKTFAQTLLAVLGLDGANVLTLDWGDTFGIAGTAVAVSVLTSIVSAGVGNNGTASMTNAVVPAADDRPLG